MEYKRVLTIQDISCVGQCSMTVALPIVSACGIETAVLPSAVLSTHTAGFSGFTVRDLADDMPGIREHWVKEGLKFDAVYTGYLGSAEQVDYVLDIAGDCAKDEFSLIVDPAMADHGKLYAGFDESYVEAMKRLCSRADILLPNLTEAAMLTGSVYPEIITEYYVNELIGKIGVSRVVLTGVGYEDDSTGVLVKEGNSLIHYAHPKIGGSCHGTGDIFAACFTGSLMQGKNMEKSVKIAADYTALAIKKTVEAPAHWYGVKFESAIPDLIRMLDEC